jgi:quercetin dioxygenase-like cupin family protein
MKKLFQITSTFVVGVVVGCLVIPAVNAQLRTTKTTNLLTTDLAGWCDGKEVTIEMNEPAPGTSGKHYHPGHSFTWVIEGSEVYEVEGKPATIVKALDLLHEEPMQVHTAANQSPVKLLVVRIVEKGKPATVRIP